MNDKAKILNNSIVEKVKKILNSTDNIDTLHIEIKGKRGYPAEITYSITEYITNKQ